ncbi:unnamed protein product [Urochloa decumbens]|uniref:Cyclin-like domain-containing protein n=1 Tax=Urochloa decumbens TaxID=240449 RepID=A0ABC8XRJ6_9POAL
MGDAAASTLSAPATPTSILICREDGNDLFPDADDGGGAGADLAVARDDRLLAVDQDGDEYVAVLLSKETAAASAADAALAEEMEDWMKAARSGCVRWIIKVLPFARSFPNPTFAASIFSFRLGKKKISVFADARSLFHRCLQTTAMFRFGGKTAYVAVTYLDRFLAQRRVNRGQEWALQLLAVACLSLASKVEEHHAPRLSELCDMDGYEVDTESILRMELLVLGTLGWRMIAATPFPYISCFAARFRQDERRPIVLRAVECVFAAIKEMSSVEYQPSTIAVASILFARGGEANLDELKAILGSSWPQLDTGHVYSCYSAMVQEDKSTVVHSAEVASSSGVSVAGSSSPDASVGTNNAAGTAPPATPDNNNKRRRLRSPQRQ